MNAIRKMVREIANKAEDKANLTLVINENREDKKEAAKMSKEYLNEKMYYFYNNGGPAMDI